MIVLLVLVPLYYWYMLQPFYIRLGKESRRVAELLSQLPKSIDVQGTDQSVHDLSCWHSCKQSKIICVTHSLDT